MDELSEAKRRASLLDAENKALALLDAVEAAALIAPGRTERAVERDIYALAERDFEITRHWHKRIVRAGSNTLMLAGDNPPDLVIAEDDIVFLDLGPVLGEWEADVGRSYAIGGDPEKHRLCADLPVIFDAMQAIFRDTPGITGAELYAFACDRAVRSGWIFGGAIAGHIIGEFPHVRIPGDRDQHRINIANPTRMRDSDAFGRPRHWIGEVHLVAPDRRYGGFYERLL